MVIYCFPSVLEMGSDVSSYLEEENRITKWMEGIYLPDPSTESRDANNIQRWRKYSPPGLAPGLCDGGMPPQAVSSLPSLESLGGGGH